MPFEKNFRVVTLTDEIISSGGNVVTTYVGKARVNSKTDTASYVSLPKRQITKYVETKTGTSPNFTTTTLQYFPEDSVSGLITTDFLFVWNNRTSITYK